MIFLIFLLEIISVVIPDPWLFFCFYEFAASVTDAATVNPNGIKTFFINGNPTFNNDLDSWISHNFILANRLFAKTLQRLEIYLLADNGLCRKLVINH